MEEIERRLPGKREYARLNYELNGDELRRGNENKKMEHNAAGLWKILKTKNVKNKTTVIGRRSYTETRQVYNAKKHFLTLLTGYK